MTSDTEPAVTPEPAANAHDTLKAQHERIMTVAEFAQFKRGLRTTHEPDFICDERGCRWE